MKTQIGTLGRRWALLLGALAMASCGDGVATIPPSTTVAGLILADDLAYGTVSLRDSSTPPQERSTLIRNNGAYAIDSSGLKAPFVIQAQVMTTAAGAEPVKLFTIPGEEIATNLSTLSTAAVAAVTKSERAQDAFESSDHGGATSSKLQETIAALRTVLAPLFSLFQVPADPFGDDGMDAALKALLRDVDVTTRKGKVLVTNRATGGVIFEGRTKELASGTFNPENMPSGHGKCDPPSTDGVALYAATCAKCHGALPGDVGGSSSAETRAAIVSNEGGMAKLRKMTDAQLEAIAAALSSGSSSTSCTSFTYSAWSACQSDGTQTRTVISASPSGCTGGNPVLSQSCGSAPPADGAALYEAKCSSCHGALASSEVQGASASAIVGKHGSKYGTAEEMAAIATALSSGSSPTTCTSFTYSAWGACQSNGTQTRTVVSASPSGCTGGNPVLSQSCSAAPSIDGAALYGAKCSSCHGALASSEVRGASASAIVGKHGSKYGTAEEMAAIATALK